MQTMAEPLVGKILVIEDDAALSQLVVEEFEEAGAEVQRKVDAHQGWQAIQQWQPELIVCDLRLPGQDGLWLLERVRTLHSPPAFIIMTAFGTVTQAVEALKRGADDFLTKPLDLDHLLITARRVLSYHRLQHTVQQYQQQIGQSDFHGLIGRSQAMQTLYATIKPIAQANGAVLISGESGTGKDLVARAIHKESPRRNATFVAVNCAAIPAELQESEFFGHVAGAFTGAVQARRGLFAEAEGGSLFLDEIGEMPLELQAKLLRVLQDGKVRQVGSNHEVNADVRIIAATNRDLHEQVAAGQFREDLYYRLETFNLIVPPLRERGDDVDLLTAHFINVLSQTSGKTVQQVSPDALKLLKTYAFPGNVRELRNAIERALAFSPDNTLEATALPERMRKSYQSTQEQDALLAKLLESQQWPTLESLCNQYVRFVVSQLEGNKRQAAKLLDISRATLYRRLEEQSLDGGSVS